MYTEAELREALRSLESTLQKCEKVLPKLKQGSAQSTLLTRRVKALVMANALIAQELERVSATVK
jgi:hypothetical protein